MQSSLSLVAALCAATLAMTGCASTPAPIAGTTAKAPQLTTLHRLIAEAGMTDTLSAAGSYTLFAPSDEAFKSLPPATLQSLSKDKQQLKTLLSHHVVPARMASSDVKPGKVKTLHGGDLQLAKSGSFVTVEDAIVVEPDIGATNGVVHVIDRVLMPPKKN